MKTTLLTLVLALLLGIPGVVLGQGCDGFYPLKKGVTGETTNFSAKGKMQSRVTFTVAATKPISGGTEAHMQSEMFDDKNKPLHQTEYTLQCRNGNILVDMQSMLNNAAFKNMKDVDMKVESAYLNYPTGMKTGDKLENGKIAMTISTGGREIATSNLDIKNRRVTGSEQITVPAGSFTANVVEYDLTSHIQTMGMGKPSQMRVKEWVSPGNGVVRTETYDDSNKLTGYTVLSKLQK